MNDGTAFIQLGRYGDIVNCLPIARRIYFRTGKKPVWFVSREFADIFDGVSYVTPHPFDFDYSQLDRAKEIAHREFKSVISCQVYGKNEKGNYYVQTKCPSYNAEQWHQAGMLHLFGDKSLQPEFDLREPVKMITQPILVAFYGSLSSPFPAGQKLSEAVKAEFGPSLNDLSTYHLKRVSDLIDFYNAAKVLVSIDTVHLHLAGASKIPLVAIVNEGWKGTIPRTPNLVERILYSEAAREPKKVIDAIHKALARG